jgi:SAM-dependent methyltransferase
VPGREDRLLQPSFATITATIATEETQVSGQPELPADDPYAGRPPTSHERHAGQPWDASYADGPAPWDIGEPQPAVRRLVQAGAFREAVLDAGCGTGENALHIASLGVHVVGVDVAGTAVAMAREKATARRADAEFMVADALHLDRLNRAFDSVLDCGLFHAFDHEERRAYVGSLASVTRPGGSLYVLCFGDADPESAGPHPVSREELTEAFAADTGWAVTTISPDRIHASFAPAGAPAWLAMVSRTAVR